MKIKEIDRTGTIAWSPQPIPDIMLAVGTAAQQLDSSFSTNAALELYRFQVNDPGLDMPMESSVNSENRFHKIVWGSLEKGKHDSGLIVGGCDGGIMQVYDVTKLLNKEESLILTKTKHTGSVRALDFNPFRSNLLGSGASDSEIFIWDLKNPKTPMSPGAKVQPYEDVLHISWNQQVEHILASAFSSRCVVWDLRKNEPIIKVSDSTARIRYKTVEWHPDVPTQMVLASEDDSNPVIQLWDLRNATSPLKILQGHQRGVLGLSWCKQDSEVLISCGKDSRILCWNPFYPHSGYEMVGEIPTTSQWTFDAQFCPKNPMVIGSSSFEGRVNVFALSGGVNLPANTSKLADSFPGMDMSISHAPVPTQKPEVFQLRDPPKWLKKPCGASFTFGGKLVTFNNVSESHNQDPLHQSKRYSSTVSVSQVVTFPTLIERSKKLEEALKSRNLEQYCYERSMAQASKDSGVWDFLQGSFSENPRSVYLYKLGFNMDSIAQEVSLLQLDEIVPKNETDQAENQNSSDENGIVGFFPSRSKSNSLSLDSNEFDIPIDDSIEGKINKALLCGCIEAAVDFCIKEKRWADALLLASKGSQELVQKAQNSYFEHQGNSGSNVIRAIVSNDMKRLVNKCELSSWRQSLATILSYANDEDIHRLCEILGERLESCNSEASDDTKYGALVCYTCSGSLNRLASLWIRDDDSNSFEFPEKLQDLVEQVMVLQKAAEMRGRESMITNEIVASKIVEYATILASQGCLESALWYLGDSTEPSIARLKEQLQYALGINAMPSKAQIKPRSRQGSESGLHRSALQKRPSHPSLMNPSAPVLPRPMVGNDFSMLTGPPACNQPQWSSNPAPSYQNIGAASNVNPSPPMKSTPPSLYSGSVTPSPLVAPPSHSVPPAPSGLYNSVTGGYQAVAPPVTSNLPPSYGSVAPVVPSVNTSSVATSIYNPLAQPASQAISSSTISNTATSEKPRIGLGNGLPPPPRTAVASWNDPPMLKSDSKSQINNMKPSAPAFGAITNPMLGRNAQTEQQKPSMGPTSASYKQPSMYNPPPPPPNTIAPIVSAPVPTNFGAPPPMMNMSTVTNSSSHLITSKPPIAGMSGMPTCGPEYKQRPSVTSIYPSVQPPSSTTSNTFYQPFQNPPASAGGTSAIYSPLNTGNIAPPAHLGPPAHESRPVAQPATGQGPVIPGPYSQSGLNTFSSSGQSNMPPPGQSMFSSSGQGSLPPVTSYFTPTSSTQGMTGSIVPPPPRATSMPWS